ncbi:MAG: hypothetical protein E7532_06495 [Ruminococcaceae bacterium]|nr:hypothetical protein [Oscillospiraceae bacterium]
MKKLLSFVLILTLILAILCISPVSAERFKNSIDSGEYWYILLDNGTVAIGSDNEELSGKLIVPDNINGYTVTEIANSGFSHSKITDVVIPDTVKCLNDYAFSGCKNLKNVSIPDSVTTIEDCVFNDCPSLKEIYIPPTVTSIGYYAIGFEDSYVYDNGEKLYDGGYFKGERVIIEGYRDSAAEKYARENIIAFNQIYEYKDDIYKMLNICEDDSNENTTEYAELYKHFETSEVKPMATPDYAVIRIEERPFEITPVAKIFGDYVMRSSYRTSTRSMFGYFIYLPETKELYTLEDAYDANIPGVYKLFTDKNYGKLIGDVNNDNELSIKDATVIQKYLANLVTIFNNLIEGYEETENAPKFIADFNRDGKLNIRDATAIQKHLAGITE